MASSSSAAPADRSEEVRASDDDAELHKLSDFIIGKPLGQGFFGRSYVAYHKAEYLVALKVLSKRRLVEAEREQQTVREIEIRNLLVHPNIEEFLGYFTDARKIYIISEFCSEGDLRTFVEKKDGKLSLARTATYVYQAADALNYMHEKGVVHRDVKMKNMLVRGILEDIKITGFGLSIHQENAAKLTTICGSLPYLPPEICKGEAYDGKKVDVWCLGVVLFELLVGQVPFAGEDEATVKKNIEAISISRNNLDKLPEAQELIGKMLVQEEKRMGMDEVKKHSFLKKHLDSRLFHPEDIRLPLLFKSSK